MVEISTKKLEKKDSCGSTVVIAVIALPGFWRTITIYMGLGRVSLESQDRSNDTRYLTEKTTNSDVSPWSRAKSVHGPAMPSA